MSVLWINTVEPLLTVIEKIPYPYYDKGVAHSGEETSPEWINYDPKKLTMSGTVSAIETGKYVTSFTPKEDFCWMDGSVEEYLIEWNIFGEIVSYPKISETLTYNEKSQSPTWVNYVTDAMTLSGDKSATNAGTYTSVFTLTEGYGWEDGKDEPYNVAWEIEKRSAIKSFSPKTMTLSLANDSYKGFTVYLYTETFEKGYSEKFSPTGIARHGGGGSVANSSKTMNICPVAVGKTTYTVTVGETANHKSAVATCEITVTA